MTIAACPVCGTDTYNSLRDPHPEQSIASDLRVLSEPLRKVECTHCFAVFGPREPDFSFGADEYDLYGHDPGHSVESLRQAQYASWLTSSMREPLSLYEAGSGNGSLFRALQAEWTKTKLAGIEPAPAAVSAARRAGFDVRQGFLSVRSAREPRHEVGLAVNVIEHTNDPLQFICMLASHAERVVIMCPDGTTPNTEVLFADHRHSFTPAHMRTLFARAGLRVETQSTAPETLGKFFMTVGRRDGTPSLDSRQAFERRQGLEEYFDRWSQLDARLLDRLGNALSVSCFGAGEAAGLLRAYAPKTWARVATCLMDQPNADRFGEKPVRALEGSNPQPVLLALRPQSQMRATARLEAMGLEAIRWDDLIPN